jgi:phospholipid/cholesterol/gamma-HCH transport system substrate-binding protein
MSPYRKNVLVGVTMLASLLILGWMIIRFGGSLATPFQGEKLNVQFVADRADGINVGSAIKYLGQTVGTVKEITLDIEKNDVKLAAEVDKKFILPGKLEANIIIPNFLGAASIIDLKREDPKDTTKLAEGAVINATYVGISIIPSEVSELAGKLGKTVDSINESGVITDLKAAVKNFDAQVAKAGQVADNLNAVLGDVTVQGDLKQSIADFKLAIADAKKTAANVNSITERMKDFPDRANAIMGDVQQGVADARAGIADGRTAINNANDRITKLGDELIARSEQMGRAMEDVRQIAEKINSGKGTAGALVNDPKLYDTLVNATLVLQETIKDVRRVANQIEQEGIRLKF